MNQHDIEKSKTSRVAWDENTKCRKFPPRSLYQTSS